MPKPRLAAAIVAEGISLDAFTNRFTAFNIMEFVSVPRVPVFLARAGVLTLYELGDEPETFTERVTFIDPTGQPVVPPSSTTLTTAVRSLTPPINIAFIAASTCSGGYDSIPSASTT